MVKLLLKSQHSVGQLDAQRCDIGGAKWQPPAALHGDPAGRQAELGGRFGEDIF